MSDNIKDKKSDAHWSGRKSILWWLFCMPGAVIIWFEYWFPKNGNVLRSQRQYGSRLAQFGTTMILYFVVGIYSFLIFRVRQGS